MNPFNIKTGLLGAAAVVGLVAAALGASVAHATTIVSTAGVNAILDEDSTARGQYFPNGSLGFKAGTFPATLNSRVPLVVPPYESADRYLRYVGVRFADTGNDGQVIVKLMEMNNSTGAVLPIVTFDSNAWSSTPPGVTSSFYWQGMGCGVYMNPYNTYWYEVTQTKNVTGPAVKAAFFDVKSYISTYGCLAGAVQPTDLPDIPQHSH